MSSNHLFDERMHAMHSGIAAVTSEDNPRVLDKTRLVMVEHLNLSAIGITLLGSSSTQVFVTDLGKSPGLIRIEARGQNALVIIDTNHRGGKLSANFRIAEDNCTCVLSTPDYGVASLGIVSLRSAEQSFYWGRGATAVGLSVEIEGRGRAVMVGDDALISSGVWIRNHDMHSIVNLDTKAITNPQAVDTLIDPHVWIGQDALLLSCERVGFGSILAAKTLVRGTIPAKSIVGGVPGRIIRSNSSWGRGIGGMSAQEEGLIHKLQVRANESMNQPPSAS
jgi:carbonic anhydrase/acetyltransferase-like protein (isoleucine patch superfamily)